MHSFDSTANEIMEQITGETNWSQENENEFSDNEVDLASELLSLSTDSELDQFLGGFIKKVAGAAGKVLSGPAGSLLTGGLKNLARRVLPMAGGALGNLIMPGVGGAIGSKLAGMAGSALGLEVGSMSADEMQEEVAKRLLRTARQSAEQTIRELQGGADPQTAVTNALATAVRRNLPGVVGESASATGRRQSGRWVRRGNSIILRNVF